MTRASHRIGFLALVGLLFAGPSAADDPKPATTAPAPGAPASEPPKNTGQAAERLGIKFNRNAELLITSDEAEGQKSEGGRQSVVFTKRVKARQADMTLESDWLEAIYPNENAHRPDDITARGSVVITQGTNVAHCSEAHIDNVACTAECRSSGGKATLIRGSDDVEGDIIYFDLCKGTVKAVGGVQVRVHEKADDANTPTVPATAPVAAPAPAAPTAPKTGGEW